MLITRKSMMTGVKRTMEIPVTFEQLQQWEVNDMPIQEVMPDISDDQREFIMTGITAGEWNAAFDDYDDEDGVDDEQTF